MNVPEQKGRKNMKSLVCTAVLLAALGFGIVGICVAGGDVAADAQQKPETADVKIDNFTFGPADLTVSVGTTVTWTNRDDIPHTVVADDKSFKSKVLDTGEKFTFTAAKPGTYSYFCSVHPKMTGKLVVE